jgi:hypothetical protein
MQFSASFSTMFIVTTVTATNREFNYNQKNTSQIPNTEKNVHSSLTIDVVTMLRGEEDVAKFPGRETLDCVQSFERVNRQAVDHLAPLVQPQRAVVDEQIPNAVFYPGEGVMKLFFGRITDLPRNKKHKNQVKTVQHNRVQRPC